MTIGPAYHVHIGTDTFNPSVPGTLYFKGSEFVDGSVRIVSGDRGRVLLERRADGVWNFGEEDLLTDTLVLSNDLRVAFSNEGQLVQGDKL